MPRGPHHHHKPYVNNGPRFDELSIQDKEKYLEEKRQQIERNKIYAEKERKRKIRNWIIWGIVAAVIIAIIVIIIVLAWPSFQEGYNKGKSIGDSIVSSMFKSK